MSNKTAQTLDRLIYLLVDTLTAESVKLVNLAKKSTMTDKEVRSATQRLYRGHISEYALDYNGTSFLPVARIRKRIRETLPLASQQSKSHGPFKLSETAPTVMRNVVEYIVHDLLKVSGRMIEADGKKIITNRYLVLTVFSDCEMRSLFDRLNIVILNGGVDPHIDSIFEQEHTYKYVPVLDENGEPVLTEEGKPKKKRQYLPGGKRMTKMKKQQESTKDQIARVVFEQCCRDILQARVSDKLRMLKGGVSFLQSWLENELINIFRESVRLTLHSGRKKLELSDVLFHLRHQDVNLDKDENTRFKHSVLKALQRLSERAGVKYASEDCLRFMSYYAYKLLDGVLFDTSTYMNCIGVKTLTPDIVRNVAHNNPI